jgi:hypothetical protein
MDLVPGREMIDPFGRTEENCAAVRDDVSQAAGCSDEALRPHKQKSRL